MPTATLAEAAPCHVTGAARAPTMDHLSWSSVSTFNQCSKRLEFQKILRAIPDFVPSALVFGQAIHQAIEAVHAARLQGSAIPGIEHLLEVYDEAWKDSATADTPVQFSKTEDENSLRSLAARMLTAYRNHVEESADEGSVVVGIEHAERFRLHDDLPDIEARIDLVELRGTDLVVTDYKTSRGKWNDAKAIENLPQLILYSYAARPLLRGLGATRIVPRFVVISKLKTTTIQTIEPKATQADADRLKAQMLEVYRAVQAGIFIPRTGWHCNTCPFKSKCPAFT